MDSTNAATAPAAPEVLKRSNIMQNKHTHEQRIATLRAALRAKYGARQYRITSSGDIHIYSQMPNSTVTGWWLMGNLQQAEDWMGIEREYI